MKLVSLNNRTEVLPALHGRRVEPAGQGVQAGTRRSPDGAHGAQVRFDRRATRINRFPVEQSLARSPESPWLGRFLDIEV